MFPLQFLSWMGRMMMIRNMMGRGADDGKEDWKDDDGKEGQ